MNTMSESISLIKEFAQMLTGEGNDDGTMLMGWIMEIEQNYTVMQVRLTNAETQVRELKRKSEGGKNANWSSKG